VGFSSKEMRNGKKSIQEARRTWIRSLYSIQPFATGNSLPGPA
jgi:hypothetical protein